MAGLLQFALGLSTGNFLNAARGAQSAIGGFARGFNLGDIAAKLAGPIAAFVSLRSVAGGVMDAIEKGGALHDLSKRTRESVSDLYQLQKGFLEVGISAESVGPMLFRMRKALGGVSEMGEPTKDVFASMGLSVDDLKKKSGPEALSAIAGALGKLGKEDAALAAGKIFGRGGAQDILALAGSTDEFNAAVARAAPAAAVFGRSAEMFDRVSDSMRELREKGMTLFVGVAEGIAPALQGVLDFFNSIDLVPLGEKIGSVFRALQGAIQAGRFDELFSAGFAAAMERVINVITATLGNPAFWGGIVQVAIGAFGALGTGLIQMTMNWKALSAAAIESLITQGNFTEIAKRHQGLAQTAFKELFGENFSIAAGFITDGAPQLQSAFANALGGAGGPMQEKFQALMAELDGGIKTSGGKAVAEQQALGELNRKAGETSAAKIRSEVDQFTRIGFFSKAGSSATDYPRQTATSTSRMAALMEKQTELLTGIAKGGVALSHT